MTQIDKEYYESTIAALIRYNQKLEIDNLRWRDRVIALHQELDDEAIRIIEVKEDEDG
jgi:hypothetical protein